MIPFRQIPIEFSTWISISSIPFQRVRHLVGSFLLSFALSLSVSFVDRRVVGCRHRHRSFFPLIAIALFAIRLRCSRLFLSIIFTLYTHSVSLLRACSSFFSFLFYLYLVCSVSCFHHHTFPFSPINSSISFSIRFPLSHFLSTLIRPPARRRFPSLSLCVCSSTTIVSFSICWIDVDADAGNVRSHVNTELVNINSVTQSKSVQTYSYFRATANLFFLSFVFSLASVEEYEKLNSHELFKLPNYVETKCIPPI